MISSTSFSAKFWKVSSFFLLGLWQNLWQVSPSPLLFFLSCVVRNYFIACILWQCLILVRYLAICTSLKSYASFHWWGFPGCSHSLLSYLLSRYMSWVITEVLYCKLCSVTSLIMTLWLLSRLLLNYLAVNSSTSVKHG